MACSALYCPYVELNNVLAKQYLKSKTASYNFPFLHTTVYFHCIPTEKELVVIVGFHRKVHEIEGIPVDSLKYFRDEDVLMLVSTMLIKRVETWAISESLFKDWENSGLLKLILKTTPRYINDCAENIDLFNIFPSHLRPIGKYTWSDFKHK